jgi:hypothetical protein
MSRAGENCQLGECPMTSGIAAIGYGAERKEDVSGAVFSD